MMLRSTWKLKRLWILLGSVVMTRLSLFIIGETSNANLYPSCLTPCSLLLCLQSGCHFPGCSCHTSSRKYWVCRGKGNWFITTKRWEILVSLENCIWTFNVRMPYLLILALYTIIGSLNFLTISQVWYKRTGGFFVQACYCNTWWEHNQNLGSSSCST